MLETDTIVFYRLGLLSQLQEDVKLHPLASMPGLPWPAVYTESLAKAEKNYPVTELETLAVVWRVTLLQLQY